MLILRKEQNGFCRNNQPFGVSFPFDIETLMAAAVAEYVEEDHLPVVNPMFLVPKPVNSRIRIVSSSLFG